MMGSAHRGGKEAQPGSHLPGKSQSSQKWSPAFRQQLLCHPDLALTLRAATLCLHCLPRCLLRWEGLLVLPLAQARHYTELSPPAPGPAVSKPTSKSDLPAQRPWVWAAAGTPHSIPRLISSLSAVSILRAAQFWGDMRHKA